MLRVYIEDAIKLSFGNNSVLKLQQDTESVTRRINNLTKLAI